MLEFVILLAGQGNSFITSFDHSKGGTGKTCTNARSANWKRESFQKALLLWIVRVFSKGVVDLDGAFTTVQLPKIRDWQKDTVGDHIDEPGDWQRLVVSVAGVHAFRPHELAEMKRNFNHFIFQQEHNLPFQLNCTILRKPGNGNTHVDFRSTFKICSDTEV